MKSTFKVTFRKKGLDQFGVGPGDLITVELVGPGRVEVRPCATRRRACGFRRMPEEA